MGCIAMGNECCVCNSGKIILASVFAVLIGLLALTVFMPPEFL